MAGSRDFRAVGTYHILWVGHNKRDCDTDDGEHEETNLNK
jgi:hypothetical protein